MTEPNNGLAPENETGKFDELVSVTIRTAVDEWRIQNDPADVHGVSLPEYIRRALADAGLLAKPAEAENPFPVGLSDLRNLIERAILDRAPVWEQKFDAGPGAVCSVADAATVATRVVATEVEALRADKDIRQGALNDVLKRERTADYYGAVEDVAVLLRAHRQLITEAERLWLERADVRGLIQSSGEGPLPADVPTQQAVSWLVGEYKKLLEQNEELISEQDEARGAAAPADNTPLRERIAEAFVIRDLASAVKLPGVTDTEILLGEVRGRFDSVVRAVVGHGYLNGFNKCACGLQTRTMRAWITHTEELRAAGAETAIPAREVDRG